MQGHTHGRWYVDGQEIKVLRPERAQLGAGAAETVCTMESSLSPEATSHNARLMAAAPELLEALDEMTDYVDRCMQLGSRGQKVMSAARAAIAKARGEK